MSDFQAAHLRLHSHNQHENTSNNVPSLEEYTSIARELYGANMVLDLSELMEVFQFPDLQGRHAELITQLKHAALDVIAWSTVNMSTSLRLNHDSHSSHASHVIRT